MTPTASDRPEGASEPGGPAFWVGAVVGWGVIVAGIVGLLSQSGQTRPSDAARWVLGAAVLHDLVLAPVVIGIGLLLTKAAPRRWRAVVQGAFVITAMVSLFSIPFVRGYGRIANNPSLLPGNYATGLLTVLAVVWAGAAVILVVHLRRRPTR